MAADNLGGLYVLLGVLSTSQTPAASVDWEALHFRPSRKCQPTVPLPTLLLVALALLDVQTIP